MKLSLAGWSLHKLFWASPPSLKLVDFPAFTRDTFGLDAVELNNHFFETVKPPYLDKVRTAADAAGVSMLNIAVDEHGELSSIDRVARAVSVANYARWIPIAAYMGIPAIRANTGGTHAVHHNAAVNCCIDSFRRLCDVGQQFGVQVLVENHTGLSFDPDFVVDLVRQVRLTHGDRAIAALADFGNWPDATDRFAALEKILPYSAAVHAKINDIEADGTHRRFDLGRCVRLCRAAGYAGHLGVEFEGENVEPVEGIRRGIGRLRQLVDATD